ncbi:unnamed protein product, partial [Staurois parvus]
MKSPPYHVIQMCSNPLHINVIQVFQSPPYHVIQVFQSPPYHVIQMFQSPPCESCDSGVPIPPPYHVISGVPIPSISCSQSPSYHVKGSIQMFQSPPSKSCDSGVPIPSISCDSGFPIPLHDHRHADGNPLQTLVCS